MEQRKTGRGWVIPVVAIVFACLCMACVATGLISVVLFREELGLPEISLPWPLGTATVEAPRAKGATLRLVGGEPVTLDPALVEDATSAEYVEKIFVGLVSLDEELQVRPELAESWDISADGTVYTFHLRSDARFQDGRPVTAADVKYSLERSCDPKTRSKVASLYLGDIVGAKDRLAGRATEVAGVEVLDDRTVRITIEAPIAYFLAKLTYSTAAVVDRNNVESGPDWLDSPNGTGPYRLAKYTDEEIILEANPYYFRGKPAIEQVRYDLAAGDPVTMYENGELDVAPVGLDDIERVQDPANPLHAELIEVPSLNVQYIGLNTRLAPFDDVKVRQAFFYATNREAIANVLFKKSVRAAKGILPPGLPGYNENLAGFDYDPERARQALAESRYGGPENLPSITCVTSLGGAILAEALAAMYKETLGVEIQIEQVEWEDFLADLNEGRHQMFSLGWSADYPDPQNFLDIQFHSQSEGNNTGYSNPQVDELLEKARVERDVDKRMALYQQVEKIVLSEAPWIPLFHGVDYVLVKPYVKNLTITAQGMYILENAYIEAD